MKKLPNYTLDRLGDEVTLTHTPTGHYRKFKVMAAIALTDLNAEAVIRRNQIALRRIVEKKAVSA